MSNIINIGIGTATKENNIKIYNISSPNNVDTILESIKTDMEETLSNDDVDVSYYGAYNNQALIDATNFFLDLENLNEDSEFYYIKQGLISLDSLAGVEQLSLAKKDFKKIENAGEKIRFFIIEMADRFLLCRINPYNQIIKNKIGIDLSSAETGRTKFDIFYGIVFPEYVSSVLDKETHKLSIVSAYDFEKMFNLKVVRMAKAENIFNKFKNGEYTIGKEKINVIFSDFLKVEKLKTRQITYLSSFDEKQVNGYDETNIEEAMSHLDEDQQLIVDPDSTIKVNTEKQFKTFVAILHNSILHRMLTNQYEAL